MITISQTIFLALAIKRDLPDATDHEIDSVITFMDNMYEDLGTEEAYESVNDLAHMTDSAIDHIKFVLRDVGSPATFLDLVA